MSLATVAQVMGPTYALTAAFMTRVGKWGKLACTYSAANMPSSELPSAARFAFVGGGRRLVFGFSFAQADTNDGCVSAVSISSSLPPSHSAFVLASTAPRPIRWANADKAEGGGG
jgi:hypothetical protein